jgi:hypothetical protein
MKQLMLCLLVLLASCTKPLIETETQKETLYYRIEQVDEDGTKTYSQVETIKIKAESCDGEDDDDDDDDHTLSVTFVSFYVALDKSNRPLLKWQVENEMPTNTYNIQRSIDAKSWQNIAIVPASGAPTYSYIDNQ